MSDETAADTTDATQYWEGRYRERDQMWSGRANRALVDVVESLALRPGSALDLGSGEGGDSIWLAERGWRVTGVDISATALERAAVHASGRGLAADRIEWVQADLAEPGWERSGQFDLVSACFLHSPIAFPREEVLRRAAEAVTPGGHLLVVGHADFPPWGRSRDDDGTTAEDAQATSGDAIGDDHASAHRHGGDPAPRTGHEHGSGDGHLPTPDEVRESLALPAHAWETVIAENRSREATGPDGQTAVLDDAILALRRRG